MKPFFQDLERHQEQLAFAGLSYRALAEQADFWGAELEPRRLAFLLTKNTPDSVTAYLALLRRAVVPLLLDADTNPDLLKSLMARYQPSYLIGPKSRLPRTAEFEFGTYGVLKTEGASLPLHPELALLMTTSGSTGSPKLVRLSYSNLASNAESIADYLKITHLERPITTLPMHYSYGLSVLNSHLARGAEIILNEDALTSAEFWERLRGTSATSFSGVPFTYEMLTKLRFEKMNLPSLRYLTQAGGKLSPELIRKFASLGEIKGFSFIVMYGQTEVTARMSYVPAEAALTKSGSIGIPIPGGDFHLEAEDGRKITEPGAVGELIYRGPNVSLGYAEGPSDLLRGDEQFGVRRTGDLAYRDADGYYYLAGRKNRFLKLFGHRVNLQEMEHLLQSMGIEAVCSGTDDNLLIYAVGGTDRDLKQELATKTGIHSRAFTVRIIPAIPRNSAGKILYTELETLAGTHA